MVVIDKILKKIAHVNSVYQLNGRRERINVRLNPDFIQNICSQNQANVVFIAKFGNNKGL